MGHRDGLVLVGHGSRSSQSGEEMAVLAGHVAAALPGVAVDVGFLEMTEPPAGQVIDRLVDAGCGRVTVLPLVLLGAGHAKSDVPALVLEARDRHPLVDFRFGSPLGVSRLPVSLLAQSVLDAGGRDLPLLVVARGTSDPDANGDASKATRLLGEWTGAPFVQVGFSGVTGPTVVEAASVFPRLGYRRIAVAWWYLCYGRLIERGRQELASIADLEVVDAGYLGPDPRLVPLIVERWNDAVAHRPVVNCDACAYRAPWPGREDRVGKAVGVGHSHLAAEHRHHHH
ncbi:MAG TPA: sirohydrochlorin chelatase [Acidimicrobiales bacterium]|jgi:sirohydrochlorin cobaltochelatase|nr:sirohydrochlorin chelatase [Acidimicrobiales bacterium]